MEWYLWLIAGWVLHWLWGVWHSTEARPVQPSDDFPSEMKERKRKIKNGLDLALATNNINEQEYRILSPEYEEEPEEEVDPQMQIVADAMDALCRLGYKKARIKEVLNLIQISGMTTEGLVKAVMAKI